MWESEDAVHAFSLSLGVETVDNLLCDAVDTAYGGDYPDFVADADLTVGTLVAHECGFRSLEGSARDV